MNELLNSCIELIATNRISSTQVADALSKSGVLPNFDSLNPGKFVVGKIHYIYAHDESNWPVHEQAVDIEENTVVYVDAFDCEGRAIFGDLVAKYILLYRKAKGIVVNGMLRDVPDLKKYDFPIWFKGATPLGCFNRPVELSEENRAFMNKNRSQLHGSILVCDDSGCTVIEADKITEEIHHNLEMIELQEDIWSYCINTLKWSTYDTVCLKKYLETPEVLPEFLKQKVKEIPFKG